LNDNAGIIDDAIVTKFDDHMFGFIFQKNINNNSHMVVNASNKYGDLEHMYKVQQEFFPNADISINHLTDKALIALQGPKAHIALQKLIDQDLSKYVFMNHFYAKCSQLNTQLQICRSGYTGCLSSSFIRAYIKRRGWFRNFNSR